MKLCMPNAANSNSQRMQNSKKILSFGETLNERLRFSVRQKVEFVK